MPTVMEFLKWLFGGAIIILALVGYATGNVYPEDIGKGFGFGVMMLLVGVISKAIRRWRLRQREKTNSL